MTLNSCKYFKEIFNDSEELIICTDLSGNVAYSTKLVPEMFGIDNNTKPYPNCIMPTRTFNKLIKAVSDNLCITEKFMVPSVGSFMKCTAIPTTFNGEIYAILHFDATSGEVLESIKQREFSIAFDAAHKQIAQYTSKIINAAEISVKKLNTQKTNDYMFYNLIFKNALGIRKSFNNLNILLKSTTKVPESPLIEINSFLTHMISAISQRIGLRVTFKIELCKKYLFCDMSYDIFDVMIWNLITNALKNSYGSTELTVKTDQNRHNNIIIISDNGSGCSYLQKLFDDYTTELPEGKSKGVGTAVIRKIVHDHGGKIAVSESPTGGIAVGVLLPVAKQRKDILRESDEYDRECGGICSPININLADVLDMALQVD